MSALPPFRQFRHAQQAQAGISAPAHQGGSGDRRNPESESDETQGTWSYIRPLLHERDAPETDVYPRSFRLMMIGMLSLLCWALMLGVLVIVERAVVMALH